MNQCAAIFLPGKDSYVGIWTPGYNNEWQTVTLANSPDGGNVVVKGLQQLLGDQSLTIHSLTHIGVMNGPAPYTQLRSHVAIANALAWSLNLPLFTIPDESAMPQALTDLSANAKRNIVIEPVYPTVIG
jgi:tRNA A37 threonylcarbamoyladenosine modification protein TsaB